MGLLRKILILFYSAFLLLFHSPASKAQDSYIKFDRMTTQNGLPQDHVFCILQDRRGFLWLGMETGLARYDGYTFKVYQHDPANPFSISSNIIKAIIQDAKGYLWIGTDGGGICRFDPKQERFLNFQNDPDNPNSLSDNRVYSIAEDRSGAIWAATLGMGLNKIVLNENLGAGVKSGPVITRFRHVPGDPKSLSSNNIWTIYLGTEDRLWIGTGTGGLNMLDLKKKVGTQAAFEHFEHQPSNSNSLSGNSVKAIFQDRSGALWVGTEFNGLNRMDPSTGKFTHFKHLENTAGSLSHDHVSAILEDKQGRLWISTNGGGLNLFNHKTGQFIHYRHIASDPYSLNGNLINTIYQDRSGIIWIGCVIKGLSWIDPQKQQTKHYYPVEGKSKSLTGNLVKVIYEDRQGAIWVGTYGGGLSQFDPVTGDFSYFPQTHTEAANAISNNVQAILEDREGLFWIGTDGGGLQRFDRKRKIFTPFNQSASGKSRLSGNSVWAICEDIRGNLWIGTADGGLNFYDRKSGEFGHFVSDPNDPKGINSHDVRVVVEDRLGFLWIGTYGGGLNRYNPANQSFAHYKKIPGDTTSLSSDIITTIFESPTNGQLWIGTFGGGLNVFDRLSESFESFREKDGLPNDVVKSIEEDREGNLWVSSLKGISKFNPLSKAFVNYNTSDGMQAEFNLGSSCLTSDGTMYFGGTNGFNVFYPKLITKKPDTSVPCLLTDLKIFNRSVQPGEILNNRMVLKETISETEEVVIPYTIDDFAFEFSALDFARSDKIEYAFQLEGVDDNWKYTDARHRYAAYSNLYQGEYLFKVRATTKDGTWNGQITQLKVKVLTAPWNTWWAYGLYALTFLGLIYAYRVYTMGRLRLLNELKLERLERAKVKEINEMKLRFFTNISHEIRTPLTLILGPLESLISANITDLGIRKQLQIMRSNANRLSILVNQLLDFRKQETGHTKLKVVKADIVKFIQEINLSFKEFAQRKNISFNFTSSPASIPLWFDPSQMEIILFNLLSNAIKFTPEGGNVWVKATEQQDCVELIVENDGEAISTDDLPFIFDRFYKFDKNYSGNYLGSGIGLALTKGLAELHGGSISAKSVSNGLTSFILTFKTGKEHFSEGQFATDFKSGEDAAHYQPPAGLDSPSGAISEIAAGSNAPELLIVEDNSDVRNYLKEIFQPYYRVLLGANGKEGFDLAVKHSPDLIISDIMMPEMDGIELCRNIKTEIATSHIPVILLTGRTSLVFHAEGLETGADDYITKPFNPGILKIKVKNLIDSRRRLRERFSDQVKLEPKEVTLTSPDEELLKRAIGIVEKHMDDSEFDVNSFAHEIGMSRPVLYRKLPALTNYTPNEFIRMIRLKRAAQLLSQNVLSVSEICYSTGFKTPKYFSKCFREAFGVSPSAYAKSTADQG